MYAKHISKSGTVRRLREEEKKKRMIGSEKY
jgi:hypothetical protein